MANKITGRVRITVGGITLLNKAGATASGLGISNQHSFERKPVIGDSGFQGFVEEMIVAECEVTITDTDADSDTLSRIAQINGDNNTELIFSTVNGGKMYTMPDAVCAGNMKLTAGEGEVTVKFFGSKWVENKV